MKIHAFNSGILNVQRSLRISETKAVKEAKNNALSSPGVKVTLSDPKEMKPEESNYLKFGGSLEQILKNNPTTTFLQALEEVASPMEMMVYGLGPYKYIKSPITKSIT
jgi:hypothetical protein